MLIRVYGRDPPTDPLFANYASELLLVGSVIYFQKEKKQKKPQKTPQTQNQQV